MNSTKSILSALGFDVKVWQLEGMDTLQVTDKEATTFYCAADCSVAQALDRYRQKIEQFQTTKG